MKNPANAKHIPKCTRTQRIANLVVIEKLALQGHSHASIAEALFAQTGVKLSRQSVTRDLIKLRSMWLASTLHSFADSRAMELKRLDTLEMELWDQWDRSKQTASGGDSAFVSLILGVSAQRCKMLGLFSATKIESSGPSGGPIPIMNVPLTEEAQQEILRRHFEREKGKYAGKPDQPHETPAPV